MTQPEDHGSKRREHSSVPAPNCDGNADLCNEAADLIEHHVGTQHFNNWFRGRSAFTVHGSELRIAVVNPFVCNWLLKRFRQELNLAAQALLGNSGTFTLKVDPRAIEHNPGTARNSLSEQKHSGSRPAGVFPLRTVDPIPENDQNDPSCSPEQHRQTTAAGPAPKRKPQRTPETTSGVTPLMARSAARRSDGTPKRRYRRFAEFIKGPCNELPLMVARQICEAPGSRYSPMFVYGGTGVGKTHLLEAVYAEIRRRHPDLRILMLTSEAFTNYFTSAVTSRTTPAFRQRFRHVDVLLIDNIEFLDRKKATQEEFLHTINQIMEHNGQVVLSADRHPRLLNQLRDDLIARFMSGMVCRIEPPSEETRRAVARALALPLEGRFTEEALNYVARKCRRNISEVQGAINCLDGHATLTGQRITLALARRILGELEAECRRLVRISDVERIVCEAFGLSVRDLRSRSRRRAVADPRSVAMYLARRMTRSAHREIGSYFGGRDHSTVVAAEKRVRTWMAEEADVTLPCSCRGRTWGEVIGELEERLLSASA